MRRSDSAGHLLAIEVRNSERILFFLRFTFPVNESSMYSAGFRSERVGAQARWRRG